MFVYLLLSQPTLAHKEDTKLFYTYPFILYSDNVRWIINFSERFIRLLPTYLFFIFSIYMYIAYFCFSSKTE